LKTSGYDSIEAAPSVSTSAKPRVVRFTHGTEGLGEGKMGQDNTKMKTSWISGEDHCSPEDTLSPSSVPVVKDTLKYHLRQTVSRPPPTSSGWWSQQGNGETSVLQPDLQQLAGGTSMLQPQQQHSGPVERIWNSSKISSNSNISNNRSISGLK
jgi:hypothetical protein